MQLRPYINVSPKDAYRTDLESCASIILGGGAYMSESSTTVRALNEYLYLQATEEACTGVHSLVVIAPPRVGSAQNNSHSLLEDCARLSRIFRGRLDGTYRSVGQTSLRFRIVDLVGGHTSISCRVDHLIKRHPETAFCLMESVSANSPSIAHDVAKNPPMTAALSVSGS
jgi:hypothetical protein